MKVFTIELGHARPGAKVENYRLESLDRAIPVIGVGQTGRGRKYSFIPVEENAFSSTVIKRNVTVDCWFAPSGGQEEVCQKWPLAPEGYEENVEKRKILGLEERASKEDSCFQVEGSTEYIKKGVLKKCDLGKTRFGGIKLVPEHKKTDDQCLIVFRTQIGFRGGNEHTGDRKEKGSKDLHFEDFPGEILALGVIAQGAAGRMGSGQQIVARMPKGVVFRTGYSGRLYGAPAAHYYLFDGQKILSFTWEARCAADLF